MQHLQSVPVPILRHGEPDEASADNLKDTADLYADLATGVLPAVSYVKPGGLNDGHPASSKYDIFEGFVKKIVDGCRPTRRCGRTRPCSSPYDEGGGYYDSGFVAGARLLWRRHAHPNARGFAVSKGVGVVHIYGDHASFLKFVEANWSLPTISP